MLGPVGEQTRKERVGAHRQSPAAVKGVDGCLGLSVSLELHKGTA